MAETNRNICVDFGLIHTLMDALKAHDSSAVIVDLGMCVALRLADDGTYVMSASASIESTSQKSCPLRYCSQEDQLF